MKLERCDLLIRDAAVIDGTGVPSTRADLAVVGDRIAAIGDLGEVVAVREVDAKGRALAPGFIDVHTHDDFALLQEPSMAAKASQGVTTVIVGNCGISLAPLVADRVPPPLDLLGGNEGYRFASFRDYLAALDEAPAALNAACLVGHTTLRVGAVGDLARAADAGEIKAMRGRLAEALGAGAIGLSSGVFYDPSVAATPEEVTALAEEVGHQGGIYSAHIRDEGDHVLESLEEALGVGRRAGAPVVVSHHKVHGNRNFGRSAETLAWFERQSHDHAIGFDVYPYIAGSTVLMPERCGPETPVQVTWSDARPEMTGRMLADVAAEMGITTNEAARRLLPGGGIYFYLDEGDVQRILAHPAAMIGSDGLPHDRHPHPRLWGTFPRVLGHYVRELGLMRLEEAVRRMTSLSADWYGLKDRGRLAPGAYADLVLFDPATIIDRSTFADPVAPAAGIGLVAVNGRVVWEDGRASGARPGRALRREAS